MKKQVLALLCMSAALSSLPPAAHSQLFARNQNVRPPAETPGQPAVRKQLKTVLQELKDRYQVDILFFDNVVENKEVLSTQVDVKQSLDKNLEALLRPLGLQYKKTKTGTYLITKENTSSERSTPPKQSSAFLSEKNPPPLAIAMVQAVTGTVTDETAARRERRIERYHARHDHQRRGNLRAGCAR